MKWKERYTLDKVKEPEKILISADFYALIEILNEIAGKIEVKK